MSFKNLILKMGFTEETPEIYLCWEIDENNPYTIEFLKNFFRGRNCPKPINDFYDKLKKYPDFINKPLFYEIEFDDKKYVGSVTLYECLINYGREHDLYHDIDFFHLIVFVFIPSRPLFNPSQTLKPFPIFG